MSVILRKDFEYLKYSKGFRPDFKELSSVVRDFSDFKSGYSWILGQILGISGQI